MVYKTFIVFRNDEEKPFKTIMVDVHFSYRCTGYETHVFGVFFPIRHIWVLQYTDRDYILKNIEFQIKVRQCMVESLRKKKKKKKVLKDKYSQNQ